MFLKVRCADCSNEQIVFARASSKVACNVCNTGLVTPTGGSAKVAGEIVAKLD